MSLAQRFERRLEGAVGSAFARVFKGQVEPVEIGTALQREAADKRAVMGNGQVLAPNRYRVSLSQSDHERLAPWQAQLCNSLAELVQESLDDNGWTSIGDVEVYLHLDDSLHTGVFGVASRMDQSAAPRRRPYDSLSLPAVAGLAPGQYEHPFGTAASGYPPPNGPAQNGQAPNAAQADGQAPYGQQPYGQAPYGQAPYGQPAAAPVSPGYPAQAVAQGYPPQGYPAQAYSGPRYPPGPAEPPPYIEAPRRAQPRAVVTVDGSSDHLVLHRGSNIVGRGQHCDLQLMDQGVSRRHVDIQFDGEFAVAYDLGSTNGTTVNGHAVGSQQLQHGDVLRLGHTRVVFQQDYA